MVDGSNFPGYVNLGKPENRVQPVLEKFRIEDLELTEILREHVTIPSLNTTLEIIDFSTRPVPLFPKRFVRPMYLDGKSSESKKNIWEIARYYLKGMYDGHYIRHSVEESQFIPLNDKKREGSITITGTILYYPPQI